MGGQAIRIAGIAFVMDEKMDDGQRSKMNWQPKSHRGAGKV